MIVEVDWTDRPVMRATSIFDNGPKRRASDRISRSLYRRTPAWSAPPALAGDGDTEGALSSSSAGIETPVAVFLAGG